MVVVNPDPENVYFPPCDDGELMANIKNITTPAAYFVGEYDPNLFYEYGAICTRYGKVWAFDGRSWNQISGFQMNGRDEVKECATNCPNCGAPLHNHKCMYCGTERK